LINGFIVIDKPAGITSHDVVSRVRRILGTRKVGHTGTLDPFATGVLPVAVNDGTKAIPFLDEGIKCYEAVMQLGVATDTLDMTGSVLQENDWRAISRDGVESVLLEFTGNLSQIPPMYSAIKRDGQPLYKLARQGQTVERIPRGINIHSLELLFFEPPLIGFRVACSRGTYVRTLADDMGSRLGCGAALKELRRTASGPFSISTAASLEELEQAVNDGSIAGLAVSPCDALAHLPDFSLSDSGMVLVRHGRSPGWNDLDGADVSTCSDGGLVRLTRNRELIAVAGCHSCGDAEPRFILKRVFM